MAGAFHGSVRYQVDSISSTLCPFEELEFRQLHTLETFPGDFLLRHPCTHGVCGDSLYLCDAKLIQADSTYYVPVKAYSRPAAGKKNAVEHGRALSVLCSTLEHLLTCVPKRFVALQGTLLPDHLYAFLTDRMRAMKQDIMVQRLHVPPPSPSPSQSSRLVSSDFVATESNSIDITSNTDLDPIRRFSSSVHLLEGMVRFLLLAANFTFFCMLTGPAYSRTHPDSLSSSSRQSATPETRTEIFDAVLHEKMLTDGLSTLLDTYRDFRLCGWCARLRGAKFDGFHPLRYEREFQGYALLLQGGDVHDAGGGSHLNTFLAQLVRQSGSLNVTKSIGTPPTKQAHVAETSIAADTDPLSFCWALVSAYHQRNWVRFFRLYAAVGVRDPLQYECLNSLTAVEEKTANDRESVYAPPLVCFSILQRMYTRPVRLAALSTVSRAFNGWVPLQTLARWLGFASDTDNDNSTSPTLSGSELESEKQTNCFLSQCLPSIKMREAGSEGPASACFQMKPLTDLKIPPVQQWVLLPQPTTLADVQFFSTPGP